MEISHFNIGILHSLIGKNDGVSIVIDQTVRSMVDDLNMDIQIIGFSTVREADGLAMSSRNKYLTEQERPSALTLFKSLKLAQKFYSKGERKASVIINKIKKLIERAPYTKIDYVKICDAKTLKDVYEIKRQSVLALAVKVGKTRLIDNYVLGEELKI